MNGRVYDPTLGRFLSVDPVFQFPTNTQSLNPYSYVMNNPLSLTDPSGYSTCSPAGNGTNNGAACEQVSLNPMTGSHLTGVNTGASCSGDCASFAMNALSGQMAKAQGALAKVGLSLGTKNGQFVGIGNGSTGQNDTDKAGTNPTDLHGPQQSSQTQNGGTNQLTAPAPGSSSSGTEPASYTDNLAVDGSPEFKKDVAAVEEKAKAAGITTFDELHHGKQKVVILEGSVDRFVVPKDSDTGYIYWNPTEGAYVRTRDSVEGMRLQSPALGLVHETGHAVDYSDYGIRVNPMPEMDVVNGVETQWAHAYHEPVRDPRFGDGGIARPDTGLFQHDPP